MSERQDDEQDEGQGNEQRLQGVVGVCPRG